MPEIAESGDRARQYGRIVLLNGASSSGKSSIARALQGKIDEPCLHLCIDDYLEAFQKGLWDNKQVVQQRWPQTVSGFHAATNNIPALGNALVMGVRQTAQSFGRLFGRQVSLSLSHQLISDHELFHNG